MRWADDRGGWASRSLDDSFQQAEAVGMGFWQLVVIYTVFASDVSVARWPLLVAHLAVFVFAFLLTARRAPAWPILPVMCGVMQLDYRAVAEVDSALWFTCFWTSLIFIGMPFILLPVRRAVWLSLLALASTIAALLGWHADQGVATLLVTVFTAIALAIAMAALMKTVREYAAGVDTDEAVAARERDQLRLRRTVARRAAEDARIMHDTLINTLSLIASGSGVVTDDVREVRERCGRDVEAVDAVLRGQHSEIPQGFQPSALTVPHGTELRRTGLDDDEVDRHVAQLPTSVSGAVQAAVAELVRNASKHSGADRVRLDVRAHPRSLVVTVSDAGRGFDGRLIAGRGLAESVVARCREADVDVAISTAPDVGTTVTLTIALDAPNPVTSEPDSAEGTGRVAETIRRTACWRFAAVIVAFGAVDIVVRQPPRPGTAYAMLAAVAGLSWLAARACRDGCTLPGWLTGLMLSAIPACFLGGLAAIDFGRAEVDDWPIIVMTALPVIVLIARKSMAAFLIGIGLLALTAAVTTYVLWRSTPAAAAVIPAGAVTQLAIISAWVVLRQVMDSIGAEHQRTLRELADDRLEREARDRIGAARARWTNAGTRRSVAVLRRIANGEAHPAERSVQRECGEAERYLRQVLLLSPEIVHMSPWLGQALSEARAKSVSLMLRPGAVDASSEQLATTFGHVVLACIDAVSSGVELGLGLFPGENGPQMLLVGPRNSLRGIETPEALPDRYTLAYQQYDGQDLIEVAATRPSDRSPEDTETGRGLRTRLQPVGSRG